MSGSAPSLASLHDRLLNWFDAERRDLPWRRTGDPYAIWVSEIMLQQTQVATVIPYYERWMARFPTVQALAAATEDDVLAMWQGLGYYRRAKLLLAGARSLSQLPKSAVEWIQIPGVGRYTAGAISSIALNQPVPLVDGNVERVFSRLTACDEVGPRLNKAAWAWATLAVHPTRPGDWNQALMELGATVCRPVDPLCERCPVSAHCQAFGKGIQSQLPKASPKPPIVQLSHHIWVPIHENRFGVQQIPQGEWWAGMWGFPRSSKPEELRNLLPDVELESVGSFRHTVTSHRIAVQVSRAKVDHPNSGLTWVTEDRLADLALPAPQRRALTMVSRFRGQLQPSLLS